MLEIVRRLRTQGGSYQGATADLVSLLSWAEERLGSHATHSEECWRWHLECCKSRMIEAEGYIQRAADAIRGSAMHKEVE